MFKKVLIANRGEIAVRVIRACKELSIPTVAVHSEVDAYALHVRMADEAFLIGPAPSNESYLVIENILEVARLSGADAVHPGYGFLSENADFAAACEASGVTFIGPSPESIQLMGSKIAARRAVIKHNVPTVPGTTDPVNSEVEALKIAKEIGFPLMLKASAGGGGKGLRFVSSPDEMESSLRATRSEALAAFGSDDVYIEKFVERPRHIEIQVLADRHGNAIHLGERECSIQRRHQKVIEESPSPIMTDKLRKQMGQAALRVVAAASYFNAGTVEFLVDQERNFYFLEMNTRLQVEHPITEAVTGIDIVKQQLFIAAGEKLCIRQEDVTFRGAAIECRIYAEDPSNNFLPCPGLISMLRIPSGPGIRDDSGVYAGWKVPLEYDPLLSKLISWAPDRSQAIERMSSALDEYQIGGIKDNISFFKALLKDPDFLDGNFDTSFIDRWTKDGATTYPTEPSDPTDQDLAVILAAVVHARQPEPTGGTSPQRTSAWKLAGRQEQLGSSNQ